MTEDSEIRRLADLLLFNDVPYRGAQVLEDAIEKKIVNVDDKLYEKLANCWIAAARVRQVDRRRCSARRSCRRTATCSCGSGEVQVQREEWDGCHRGRCSAASTRAGSRIRGNAQLHAGHRALQPEEATTTARPFFERARQSEKHRQMADGYLQAHPGPGLIAFF